MEIFVSFDCTFPIHCFDHIFDENRSLNPKVTIGLSIAASIALLRQTLPTPFLLIVTTRTLKNKCQDSPVSLATHSNPSDYIDHRSSNDIDCIHPKTGTPKLIEIWSCGWPNYFWDRNNLRETWDVFNIPSAGHFEVKELVGPAKMVDTEFKKGEKYQTSLTIKCLGTR